MTAGTGASSTRGARCSPCLRPSHAAARGCGRVGILDEDVHDVKDRLTVCCAVRISAGDLLLVRRIDDGNWDVTRRSRCAGPGRGIQPPVSRIGELRADP
jgi:hypothetical protein